MNRQHNQDDQADTVPMGDVLLLRFCEHIMRTMAPTPELERLVLAALFYLAEQHPEQVKVHHLDAEEVREKLCDDPECDSCARVRRLLREHGAHLEQIH